MPLHSAFTRLLSVPLAVLLALAAMLGVAAAPAAAAGTPDLGLAIDEPSSVLQGVPATITLTAGNPTGPGFGYNLSYRAVLPAGVSYVGGSASANLGAPTILANSPAAGQTTLLWLNVADLSVNSTNVGSFAVNHAPVSYPIGSSFAIQAGAYVNSDPRFVPKFAADGTPTPGAASFTGSAATAGATTINAIEIRKSEPSPEGELLRGIHDHQTNYTLTYRNNGVQPTTGLIVDDYLPAGLEFLGCGGAGADHTTNAPTNPGSTNEYPGSGPVVVPAVAGCVTPTTVETLTIDPDGAGPLPSGVYTHVQWTGLGTIASGATGTITYRAAIPMRANTMTFSGGTPAITGAQSTNLDNNSGPEATDEQALTNLAKVSGNYNGTLPVTDSHSITRTAEDLRIQKSVNLSSLAQGQISVWTLKLEASEYRYSTAITVTDTLPDGLCPLGASNFAQAPTGQDAECAPFGGNAPSHPFATVAEQSSGAYALTWNSTTDSDLALLGRSATATITFPTRTRVHYQEGFADAGSVLAGDRISNGVATTGTARVVCAGGPSDCSGAGAPIDHDGPLAVVATDVSDAGQATVQPVLEKRVASTSTNCSADSYVKTAPIYHPGDRICWQLRVAFPSALDTQGLVLTDFLPANVTYDPALGAPAGDLATAGDTIPGTTLDNTTDIPTAPAPGGQLHWTLPSAGVVAPSRVFEHQVATTVALPLGAQSGDIKDNLFKMASSNTAGVTFPLRDAANFQLQEPEVDLTKRITQIDGTPVAPTSSATVGGAQLLTFTVQVKNTGDVAAEKPEVWDELPPSVNCGDISNISNGGSCSGQQIKWGASPAVLPTVAAGGQLSLTYMFWVPTTIGPGLTYTNTAGVRQFQTPTNQGGNFTYIPQNNIDPTQNASANVPAADDTATVTGRQPTIAKTRTSPTDGANNSSGKATIGEVVHYTVTATVPRGEVLTNASLTDPALPSARQPLVAGTTTATRDGVPVSGGFVVAETGGAPSLTFPANYSSSSTTDEIFVLGFDVTVADVATNVRGGTDLSNTGRITYDSPNTGLPVPVDSTAVVTPIVEPVIRAAKANDTAGNPVIGGQVVTYTVTLRNGTVGTPTSPASNATISPAHETSLVDTVPSGLTPQNAAGNPILDGESTTSGGVWNLAARTLTFSPAATIEAGASATFTYKATVNDPAIGGSALTNSVAAKTTSLAGTPGGERTANVGTSTGYSQTATNTLTVQTASLTKGADRATLTIGDNVVYRLDVTIPAQVQLYDTTVTDVLPDGIDFDGYTSATCITGCPPETPPTVQTYTRVVGAATTTAAWSFGDLAPTANARVIRLLYHGHLRATHRSGGADVVDGQTAVNSARVSSNRTDKVGPFDATTIPPGPFDDNSTIATHTLTAREPGAAIDKQIAVGAVPPATYGDGPVPVHSGDAIHYRVTVRNTGSAPLYDVTVNDQPDAELTAVTLTTNSAMNTDPWTAGNPAMQWLVPGPIPVGGSVTLSYDAGLIASTSLHDAQLVDNTASAPTSFGVPSAQRTADGFTYRSYDGGTDATQAVVDVPTISLVKTTGATGSPDSAPVQVGQNFTWRVVVTNTSTTAGSTALVVHDVLPRDWTYTAGSSTFAPGGAIEPTVTAHAAGDDLDWATPITLAPGASTTLTFQAKPTLAAATSIGTGAANPHTNRATAAVKDSVGNSADADGPFASNADTADAVLSIPVLTVAKTPDAGSANAGSTVNYHVIVRNTGSVGATDVVVTDTLPAAATYTAGAATAAPAGGFSETSASAATVVWNIATLAAGAQVDITVPVKTDPSSPAGTDLVNTASAIGAETPSPASDQGNIVLATSADLVASKSALPNPATAGDPLTYTLGVHNNGPSDAHGVALHDTLPSTVTFVSASAGCVLTGGTVDCMVGDLASGADATATITVAVNAGVTTNADNVVTVDAATTDPAAGNNTASSAVPVGTNYDLSVVKTALQPTVLNGANATFRIAVHNAGPSTATAVQISDPLPAGLAYVSDDRGCVEAAGTLTCMLGAMAPGADDTINVLVTGIATGVQTNTATVSATGSAAADRDHTNDSAAASITVDPSADLELTKTGPAKVAAGGVATYSLEVTNNGPDDATGVVVTDTLPAGTTFESGDVGCTASATTPVVVTCTVGALANGAGATRAIAVRVPIALGATAITNTAKVSGAEGDLVPSNDQGAAVTQVGPAADLALTKTGPETVGGGGTLTWTMVVTNNGPSPATGVQLTDVIPAGVSYLSSAPSQGTCATDPASGNLGCDLGTLAAGDAVQVLLTVNVPTELGGTAVTNTAAVLGVEPDKSLDDNKASATTQISVKPATTAALAITKKADGPAKVGAALRYTITVTNNGPSESTDTVITDALKGSVEFRLATADQGSCSEADGTVTCNLGTLANGQTTRAHVTVIVTKPGQLPNIATVSSPLSDRTQSDNLAAAVVQTTQLPTKLAVEKFLVQRRLLAGHKASYRIRVKNLGSEVATEVLVCDALPRALTLRTAGQGRIINGKLCFDIPRLVPGHDRFFLVKVNVSATAQGRSIRNRAIVRAANAVSASAVDVEPLVRVRGIRTSGVTG